VHHVAHPQLAGVLEAEAALVCAARRTSGLFHQACPTEQAVHRGRRQGHLLGLLAQFLRLVDHHRDRPVAMIVLDLHQQVGHRLRDGTALAGICARLRPERVEATLLVELDPVAQRADTDTCAT
jgi:hypothetical protein